MGYVLVLQMSSLKHSVVSGTIWAALEKASTQFVSFFVTLILARLLTPADYGTVALLQIFIVIANVIVDSGFGQALVRKNDASDKDFNTVFYLSLIISVIIYIVLFFAAPTIARFYASPELIPILRVMSLSIVFNAINSVQNAELNRKMLFNLSFRISLITVTISGCSGVVAALMGLGPWAIVIHTISANIVGVVARWFIIAWRPRLMFSLTSARSLFAFGWKMMVSQFINVLYANLYGLIIGKVYTKTDLSFTQKGAALPVMLMDAINGTLMRVSFPALSRIQDDLGKLRDAMRKMIVCSTYLVFPLMTGLAVCADSVVVLLFGDQWIPIVPYVRLACFSYALYPFSTINLQALVALGRSDVFLCLEVVKKVIGLIVVIATYRWGVFTFVLLTSVVIGPMALVINNWPNRRLLKYSVGMQLRDVMPSIFLCVIMGITVCGLGMILPESDKNHWLIAKVTLQFLVGVSVYFALSFALKIRAAQEYIAILSERMSSKYPALSHKLNALGRWRFA